VHILTHLIPIYVIAKMANATSSSAILPPNENRTGYILGIGVPIYGLAAIACILRIYTKLWPRVTLALDDYFIMIALVS
jgi:hypothetical protein